MVSKGVDRLLRITLLISVLLVWLCGCEWYA
jgi:hypothetical protein